MSDSVVVVGGGQAGSELAFQLRQRGFSGAITILGDEAPLPYARPPLSKAFLSGETDAAALTLRAEAAYARLDVAVQRGVRVERIDRHARLVRFDGGTAAYDVLVLATGGRARRLLVPGAGLGSIHTLRTLEDAVALRAALVPGARLTIVGGGYVGLEAAAIAVRRGVAVTVLEGADRVLARVAAPEISAFLAQRHAAEGVDIRTRIAVSGFVADATGRAVGGVECGEGATAPADCVLVGIGMVPNFELAEAAGLVVDGGVVVDAQCRTSDAHVYAIGDCAMQARHDFLGRAVRLESVPNALEQAREAARAILQQPAVAAVAPWFWSDQYDVKLQMVGLAEGYENLVLRGSYEAGSFVAFYLSEGRIVAADAVNRPAEFMAAKRLVSSRRPVEPRALSDESVALRALLG